MKPTTPSIFRMITISAALLIGAMAAITTPASAVINSSVRNACMSDYFSFCAGMEVGGQELRRCMNKAGPKLQPACVSALVAAGEVSKAEVNRRAAKSNRAGKSRVASRKMSKPSRRQIVVTTRTRSTKRQYATLR